MTDERLDRIDFGLGLMAGLHERGVHTLDEYRLIDLHASFLEAFKVVEEELGSENLRFVIITHDLHGTSGDVFQIFSYWLGSWATKDAPGTIWRFEVSDWAADRIFGRVPGDREMYLRAADAFLDRYRQRS